MNIYDCHKLTEILSKSIFNSIPGIFALPIDQNNRPCSVFFDEININETQLFQFLVNMKNQKVNQIFINNKETPNL